MRLHHVWRYCGMPREVIKEAMASGAIHSFVLRSQYHRKLRGIRPVVILVNVESLDKFIETKERESKETAEEANAR
jgi:hypothetical protein